MALKYPPPADPNDIPRAASIASAVVQGDTVAVQMCAREEDGGGPILEIHLSPQSAQAFSSRLQWLADAALQGPHGSSSTH